MTPHFDEFPDFAECDICRTSRHLCLTIPIRHPEYHDKEISVCVMCAKKIARAYTRFVATVKSRSYLYWYQEREKLKKAGLKSGLESSNK